MANTNLKLGRLAKLGLLAALSIVLVFFIHFPIFPTAKFLEYDPADIPIMIATFAFGPWYGLMTTIVVAVVQGLTVSASGGIYGIIMHIIATGTFVLVAGFLYQKHKTKKGALIALLCGVVAWGLIMMPANLIITPIFTGMPVGAIRQGDPRSVNAEGGHPFAGGDNDIGGGEAEGVAEMVSLDDTAGKGELFFHKITDAEAAKRFCRRGRSQRR